MILTSEKPMFPSGVKSVPDALVSAPVLSVRDLTTSFKTNDGWKSVIRGISFDVAPRETVAIVGESGSGKSVTSLSIMRLLQPHSSRIEGSVRLNGRELLSLEEEQMRRVRGNGISMIFQEPMTSLNPIFPIGKQIAEALTVHTDISEADAKAEVIRLLDKVRIPNALSRFDEYPHQFSGGMRQRVMIAMALASRPKLLIADEPTTALDVTIQGQILDLIKTLQDEEGMSVLFITHDMGVVAEVADRTIVMYRGDAVETGETSDIFHRGRHPYTRALLSAVPRLGSMGGRQLPLRFPSIDMKTGEQMPLADVCDTVASDKRPVLEVKGLTTRFEIRSGFLSRRLGAVHAVENVSFDLYEGETLSIVGESGCGKSTTGRSVTRLITPTSGALRISNRVRPSSLTDVQYSIPYCLALAAIAGPQALLPLTLEALSHDGVSRLASRVRLSLSPEFDARFPAETLARVTIRAGARTVMSDVTAPLGEASKPLSWSQLEEKFRAATGRTATEAQRLRILKSVDNACAGDIGDLMSCLEDLTLTVR